MQPQDKIEALLPAYLDGELDEPQRRQVETALDHSAEQRELLAALTQTVQMLNEDKNNLRQHPAPPPAPNEIQQMLRQWQKQPAPRHLDPHPWFLPWSGRDNITGEPTGRGRKLVLAGIGLAAAFALTITIISAVLLGQRTPSQVVTNGNPTSPTTGQDPTATAAPLPTSTANPTTPVSTTPAVNKLATGKHSAPVTRLAWSPDGKYLATGSKNNEVFTWNSAGKQVGTLSEASAKSQGVTSLVWSPDGQILAIGTSDDTIYFSKKGDFASKAVLQYAGNYMYGNDVLLAFSPDNKIAAAGFSRSGAFMLLPRDGKESTFNNDYTDKNQPHQDPQLTSLAWSPDGKILAIGWVTPSGGVVRLFNPDGSVVNKGLKPSAGEPQFITWSPDGKLMAVGYSHNSGQIWTAQGTLVADFGGFSGSFSDLAWSPDGKTLAGAFGGGQVWLWDSQGKNVQTISNLGGASKLAWSPDGKYLAGGLNSGQIQLWDIQAKQVLNLPNSPGGAINGLAWQPGGQTLAAISEDQTVQLWSVGLVGSPVKVPGLNPTPPTGSQWQNRASTYDPINQQVIVFGGNPISEPQHPVSETWAWNGKTWQQLHPAHSPTPRSDAHMVYDAARKQVILFGGQIDDNPPNNETWAWNGHDWLELHPAHSPPARSGTALVYDAARKQVVLFSGFLNNHPGGTYYNETWVWNGQDWTQKQLTVAPLPRVTTNLVYDALHQKVILFGGNDGGLQPLSDMWSWDGKQWTQLHPTTSPSTINSYGPAAVTYLVYDEKLQRLVLLTGHRKPLASGAPYGEYATISEVWIWDGQNWSDNSKKLNDQPSIDSYTGYICYDTNRQAILLLDLGTLQNGDPTTETWLLSNGTTWQKQ